ncbi:hypothetical protein G6F22_018684 [Rhizopus arrhizus]|nr:hypothetical protein G6F22_018684 [Rhizopus arrhizus]
MAVQQLFHRLPARARGVEHQAVVAGFQQRRHLLHAGGGHAEHRDAHGGPPIVFDGDARLAECARDRAGGIGQHATGDAIQPRHVGHRIHHGDIGGADVRRNVARGHRRHHQLWRADGQRAHGRCDQRGAAGTAQAQQGADGAVAGRVAFKGQRHGGNCRTAVAGLRA